ncbi:sperm acrosome membrane-associated protein 4-like [Lampris incognitus]|uniref:sperm acrosome membrane-associated protein 4-like n=1 Tax=Lampris incognitus TaxID=2546036 RepID=UPI0024B5F37D|nr:sperm acrosome membrane-associated protein 4-like [Lampris incognitus]
MRGFVLCVFVIVALTPGQGEERGQAKQLSKEDGYEEEGLLECFRCDLGFWDACYTTIAHCSAGERCYTGRGKAADVLDIKTLGCARADECEMETTVELFSNTTTIYTMTKYCCDTPFCNGAGRPPANTLLYLTVAVLTARQLAEVSAGPQ